VAAPRSPRNRLASWLSCETRMVEARRFFGDDRSVSPSCSSSRESSDGDSVLGVDGDVSMPEPSSEYVVVVVMTEDRGDPLKCDMLTDSFLFGCETSGMALLGSDADVRGRVGCVAGKV